MSTLHTTRLEAELSTTRTSGLKTLVMLAGAPFIGLLFIVALPAAGLVLLGSFAASALMRHAALRQTFKRIAIALAAPFIGLAYVALLPLVGLAMLATVEIRALRPSTATA